MELTQQRLQSHPVKPPECRMTDEAWKTYCDRIQSPSDYDWCRSCGRKVRDNEYLKYGFADNRCCNCR